MVLLEEEGDILLADSKKITVFAVSQSNLPPGAQILLGIEHLKELQISVDFAMLRPFCQLSEARAFGKSSLSCGDSLLDRSSGFKESYCCLPKRLSLNTTLAMTSVLLLFLGLGCLLKGTNWSGLEISLLNYELSPIHIVLESVLLICLFLFAAKGIELSRLCFSLTEDLARVRTPRVSPCLPPDYHSQLKRMHANSFASVFAPQPSYLQRESPCAWGKGASVSTRERSTAAPNEMIPPL